MTDHRYGYVDLDNHYYEPLHAWTEYVDPRIRKQGRGVEVVEKDGRTYLLVGGTVRHFVPNVTFDPVAAPGSLEEYFRGEAMGRNFSDLVVSERLRPEYQQRIPREEVMAAHGVDEAVLLPTFAYCVEEGLSHDVEAMHAQLHGFNCWLLDEWGFKGPTIAAPMLALSDVASALRELEWIIENGGRIVTMRPGPVALEGGNRCSPANPRFDPVWNAIEESGLAVAYHAADSGYFRYFHDYDDPPTFDAYSRDMRLGSLFSVDRPMQDMLGVMVLQGLFQRFPRLKLVSVEQGSDWLLILLKALDKQYKRRTSLFSEPPIETIRRNVWVCPFWEDDIDALVDVIGIERVVLGSDWPHPEGVREPGEFRKYLAGMSDGDVRAVMRDNGAGLLTVS